MEQQVSPLAIPTAITFAFLFILFVSLAKQLRLGDVVLAVNGRSLQGASHSEAVSRLKQAGHTVLLRVRPNQLLEGEWSEGGREWVSE